MVCVFRTRKQGTRYRSFAIRRPALSSLPFLFGAQYYRAPTPEPGCWEPDLKRMRELGFNSVKYWVQWRWSHRAPDMFVFDDTDRLMDLAAENGLQVTLNTIFDVSPSWLFDVFPDAYQVRNDGRRVEPYAVAHRQIGGHPGPCYNHPGALDTRRRFLETTVRRYAGHPAMAMWDVWNEPELCYPQRAPELPGSVCYCAHCARLFLDWLRRKYGDLETLNQVWGRCYREWREVELPRNNLTVTDFIDWREFHLDTMTTEARWRLAMVGDLDPDHVRYLHVVPNTMSVFNSVACADDFALAEDCHVFAATTTGQPLWANQVISAGRGKVCYNVESHINSGALAVHQAIHDRSAVLRDLVPQIGMGIRGFLFWQYRSEVLGGCARPVTTAVREFWERLEPHTATLMNCPAPDAAVGLWKSRRNEIFHFCVHQSLNPLVESVNGYIDALYWSSVPYRIVSEQMLEQGDLEGLQVLIMPSCYYLTDQEASALDRWVRAGGVLFCEAHLAGYSGTRGRHERVVPGAGLAASWGIREVDTCSPYHLRLDEREAFSGAANEDLRKALEAYGTTGGRFFPIALTDGGVVWGADRYAQLECATGRQEGSFDGCVPCLVSVPVGRGRVVYNGANLGAAAQRDPAAFVAYFSRTLADAGVAPTLGVQAGGRIHADLIRDRNDRPCFVVLVNGEDRLTTVSVELDGHWRGVFSDARVDGSAGRVEFTLEPGFADLLVQHGVGCGPASGGAPRRP
jgi:beta-galactosidase